MRPRAAASLERRGWKQALDILCIVMVLPFISPLMVLIGLWIKLVSRGPVVLRQQRIGRDGQLFFLYKFRTMQTNSRPDGQEEYVRNLVKSNRPMIKLELIGDSRLVLGGCLLRASGLDELPQLLNVFCGQMSLVGPRPCLPAEYPLFSAQQRERFNALPGLTGIWQVTGKNKSTFREMNAMDIHYVRNASLKMDLEILLRTPGALLRQMIITFQQRISALRGETWVPLRGGRWCASAVREKTANHSGRPARYGHFDGRLHLF